MGGLVVKKALILAHERSSAHGALLRNVFGVIFLGTPHRGSRIASWGSIVASAARAAQLGTGTNSGLVTLLSSNSDALWDISTQFIERAEGLDIRTFYETETMEAMNSLIVDIDSARLNLPNESAIPIGANHRDMCKYSAINSQRYRPVWEALQGMVESAVKHGQELPELHQKILACLHRTDYEEYKETIDTPVEGTCTWFLQNPKYKGWLHEEGSSALWVSGDAGSGKTVLSTFLIDGLKKKISGWSSPTTVCYFFCDEKLESQNDGSAILAGLLHQIFCSNSKLIHHAENRFKTNNTRITRGFQSLWTIFQAVCEDPFAGNLICVVDGLDECDESSGRQFIERITSYVTNKSRSDISALKVLMTSRGNKSIEDSFRSFHNIRIRAEDLVEFTKEDVAKLIRFRLNKIQASTLCSDDTKRRIECELTKKADRTFLWVSLILDLIEKSSDASDEGLILTLSTLPRELNQVYESILDRSPDPKNLVKLLSIIVASQRPLSLTELNMALSIRPSDRSRVDVQPRWQPNMSRRIKGVCGPFVRIIHGRVYLVHQTAKEFLLCPSNFERSSPFSWEHRLELPQAHLELAQICIWYLAFDDFMAIQFPRVSHDETDVYSITNLHPHEHEHELLDYASNHWGAHVRLADTAAGPDLLQNALRLVDPRTKNFQTWFQLYWISIAKVWRFPDDLTSLMIASHLGLRKLVQIITKDEVNLNTQDEEGWTAMHWAVWEGHGVIWDGNEAVKQLLSSGALPTVIDKQGMAPLHWAVADGQENIVQLLLDSGAPVDMKDCRGSTALHLAAENSHVGVLELLIDHGADIDAVDCDVIDDTKSEEAGISINPAKRKREGHE
ncbi:uncharacterized protein N7498_004793 [Penicillium cinerascens]|uniref:NACHT domain-containing protein n=1 Tax=Penicillium cinerascens TaxID=70096 RepID=A0A9W9SZK1_9EURO|nr:uncharacterized protein N7498_004793 [Penicillium cinerascens]KAJ5203914.1 hypothetical protein N7498_004793 [Penicillium cinerascens]